jgi:hypothetical protein
MPDPAYLGFLRQITQNAPTMPLADRQRLASMGGFAQSEGVDIGMYGDRDAAGYGMMLDDLDARQGAKAPAPQPAAPKRPQRTVPFATQTETPTVMGPDQQYGQLQGMANQAMSAWSNELDSRVAQNREQRRMQHEKDMERMRQETALKKIAAEQQASMMQMRMADAARRGDNSKTYVPGRGFLPSWML